MVSDNYAEIIAAWSADRIIPNIPGKIFLTFFATRPATKGSGPSFSLSYDIVKAEGGEIKVIPRFVDAKMPSGTEFIVMLPLIQRQLINIKLP